MSFLSLHLFEQDDVLDFEGSEASLGKPALNDLKEGLATAPVLLAAEQHPELLVRACGCLHCYYYSLPLVMRVAVVLHSA
jgi:Polyprenyl synthetase